MKQKEKTSNSGCRYGCSFVEDMYHIFVHCQRFREWREEAMRLLKSKVEKHIDEYKLKMWDSLKQLSYSSMIHN